MSKSIIYGKIRLIWRESRSWTRFWIRRVIASLWAKWISSRTKKMMDAKKEIEFSLITQYKGILCMFYPNKNLIWLPLVCPITKIMTEPKGSDTAVVVAPSLRSLLKAPLNRSAVNPPAHILNLNHREIAANTNKISIYLIRTLEIYCQGSPQCKWRKLKSK